MTSPTKPSGKFDNFKRIVVKVGSNVLVPGGKLDLTKMRDIAEEMSDLHDAGKQVIFVTSGAIAAGKNKLGLPNKIESIQLQQASAAVGQSIIMENYRSFFEKRGKNAAQILLTQEDFTGKKLDQLKYTFEALFNLNAIPVVNENDTVTTSAHDAMKDGGIWRLVGDNDMLAAFIATALKADAMVILSDVEGLLGEDGKLIKTVEKVDDGIFALEKAGAGGPGRGGIRSKLKAAKKATANGITVLFGSGKKENALKNILSGEQPCTVFKPFEGQRKDLALEMATAARKAWSQLAQSPLQKRNHALELFSQKISSSAKGLLEANAIDVEGAKKKNVIAPVIDRLTLNEKRIAALSESVKKTIANDLQELDHQQHSWTLENGLKVTRKQVPFGVLFFIFEGRPNVAVDACALAIKTGNAVLLKGSRSATNSNKFMVKLARQALGEAGLPEDSVQLFEGEQEDFLRLLRMEKLIDIVVPRGGEEFIEFVKKNSSVPLLYAGGGVCHVYVDKDADDEKAVKIVINAKTQRPGVCNAAEVLLVHEHKAKTLLPKIAGGLLNRKVELRCDDKSLAILSKEGFEVKKAGETDFDTEFGDLIMAVKIVASTEEAIAHINQHGTHHSDSIVTENPPMAQAFLREVDSACVYWNASTRFTDSEVFGFGPELCISTQKLHSRGPLSLKHLFTNKYEVEGKGQIRE